ncbi:MAG: dephospho-CoA kinase [Bacteroidales bacterium]|nr:dephospho-CoA kinase [Bacteroidales bacterium]
MIIAITGGIGSGKSIVSRVLEIMGHKVYDCDREAKRLMLEDPELIAQLKATFGEETYLPNGMLNKPYLAAEIFGDEAKLKTMNSLVHPAVARDFMASGCQFVESAILYESGFDQKIHHDQVWCVAAPLELRIQRALIRDNAQREQVLARIESQMAQEEKIARADATIWNDSEHSIIEQINTLLGLI